MDTEALTRTVGSWYRNIQRTEEWLDLLRRGLRAMCDSSGTQSNDLEAEAIAARLRIVLMDETPEERQGMFWEVLTRLIAVRTKNASCNMYGAANALCLTIMQASIDANAAFDSTLSPEMGDDQDVTAMTQLLGELRTIALNADNAASPSNIVTTDITLLGAVAAYRKSVRERAFAQAAARRVEEIDSMRTQLARNVPLNEMPATNNDDVNDGA